MPYALVSNGAVLQYPVDLFSTFPNVSFPVDLTNATLPDGCVSVADASPPPTDEGHVAVEVTPALIGQAWTRRWEVEALSADQIAANLANAKATQITAASDARSAAADSFSYAGFSGVASDDQAQGRLTSTITALALPGVANGTTVGWEMTPGDFVVMGLADLQAFAGAMLAHVQGCWAVYANACAQINAANTIADVQAAGVGQGYPAQ